MSTQNERCQVTESDVAERGAMDARNLVRYCCDSSAFCSGYTLPFHQDWISGVLSYCIVAFLVLSAASAGRLIDGWSLGGPDEMLENGHGNCFCRENPSDFSPTSCLPSGSSSTSSSSIHTISTLSLQWRHINLLLYELVARGLYLRSVLITVNASRHRLEAHPPI